MTTTQPTQETVSTIAFDRPASAYDYLGEDARGEHHHHDRITNTIHVTETSPTQLTPDHTDEPWIRVHGPSRHTEHLDAHDDGGVSEWFEYVQSVRGWTVALRRDSDRVVCELERPATLGDVERAFCALRGLVATPMEEPR